MCGYADCPGSFADARSLQRVLVLPPDKNGQASVWWYRVLHSRGSAESYQRRIMQFLPPEDALKNENYLYTRVRLAWYYRPVDVSDHPLADSRLLLAAILG